MGMFPECSEFALGVEAGGFQIGRDGIDPDNMLNKPAGVTKIGIPETAPRETTNAPYVVKALRGVACRIPPHPAPPPLFML